MPNGRLATPAVSTTEKNDSTAAPVQTWASSRRTGMPSRAARSARSADARTATPVSVNLSTDATTASSTGATTRAITSLASKTTPPSSTRSSNGVGSERTAGPSPHRSGRASAAKASTCDRPMVATVRMRRGER